MNKLDYRSVEDALSGCRWSKHILTYERIGSTMDRSRELAHKGAPEGTLVVAAEQTEGRGRLSRAWVSPVGSLSLSLLLHPSSEQLPYLTMLAGLAAAEAIEAAAPLKADLKWPNDILIGGRKVAGILVESGTARGKTYAAIGIGVNVNMDMAGWPDLAGIATSLSAESGRKIDTPRLLRAIVDEIAAFYTSFDPAALRDLWRARLVTLGRRVTASGGGTVVEGVAAEVTADGALVILGDDGAEYVVVAGDVTLKP
ncbi:biotin--[acetyl-CoA-carboxylase] ligase [Dehalogenimonas alkenigignens]|uniref:biotin--[biotin carboxyl-carrier protein] ligase n=1 Tax=Dehalogenimonas alkenigignens TaxID=1217799 RepID=A0A0W0GJH1_9CHLR|nr:biotin--[acetyl-CoA-carboxylase] ligase [Dehalogenimonas alkenigignens]KTB48701.1 birA, biotin-[acetyl-CoA-carboxylase] ligase region [Dehalogenimonas alkenigignens]PVV84881.1 biotin--[acetyl-CoA-carboxylase] ligase [Dehalogenimonas alkenigignens]